MMGAIMLLYLLGHTFAFTPTKIEQICSKSAVKMNLKRKHNNVEQIKKILQINNSEHCQWPGAWYRLLTSIYLICPHLHMTVVLSLRGRECGKALTLPLKLVMETCSWGQRMDWAWQPISSRKPFSGGAKAARCDPMRLSAGGKADGPNGCPWRLLRPAMPPNLKHSVDNAEAGLVSLRRDEEQRFEAKAVPRTADRITDAPTVSITSPNTT